jgi:hypothetical protein
LNQGKAQAPPLPQPRQPIAAAVAVAVAAEAAARSWAQHLDPARHGRAVSQLHSVLRDLGIAARGLAAYQAGGMPPGPAAKGFGAHVSAGSALLLEARERLDGILAAEGLPPSGDPDEPGAALCQAARDAILAWRQPSGTQADRDGTVQALATTVSLLATATAGLAARAPRQLAIALHAAGASLTGSAGWLAAAIQPAGSAAPDHPGGAR